MPEDKILVALAKLERQVTELSTRVDAHQKKLGVITSAALLVIGMVGGPNAVHLVTTGTV